MMILTVPVDEEEMAEKVRGLMHMHTMNAKITKHKRATGVYGIVEFYIVSGMFRSKENAKIAQKEIHERFFN